MANLITSKDYQFDGSFLDIKNSKEKEVSNISIKAPMINYLPINYWMNNYTSAYMTNCLIDKGKYIHYDFHNPVAAVKTFCNIDITNAGYFNTNETYTFVYKITNIQGTQNLKNNTWHASLIDGTKVEIKNDIDTIPNNDFIDFIHFELNNKMKSLIFNSNRSHFSSIDLSYDFTIIGLYIGNIDSTEIIKKPMDAFTDTKTIITSDNQDSKLGQYEISRDVRRHIKKIERDILNLEGANNIGWR